MQNTTLFRRMAALLLGFLTMVAGGGSLNLRRRNRSRRR